MITSTVNQQVKNIMQLTKKAKERQKQKVFLAEGLRLFEELPEESIVKAYLSESFFRKDEQKAVWDKKIDRQGSFVEKCEVVSDAVFARMSDTQSPQGILCVVRQQEYQLEELFHDGQTHLLVLEGIQDPGNLGTIFRTGEGAGVTGIIMNRCVDLFAPKTVRSTMGSICRVPYYITENLPETLRRLKQEQIRLYAAHLNGKKYYDEFGYDGPTAFLIGNEANGLSQETAEQADVYLKIPMGGKLESLNAAMAAGILIYEVNRQRRNDTGD